MEYCTPQEVLDKVGVTTTEIDDDQLKIIVKDASAEVERIIKTTCQPRENIEILYGNDQDYLYLKRIPLLSVKELKINTTSVSIDNLRFDYSGQIKLLTTAEAVKFYSSTKPNVGIKYLYGWVEEEIVCETQEDVEAGSDVEIEVPDSKQIYVGNWIKIIGTDGYSEWAKVKTKNDTTNIITCDLVYDHATGSYVIRADVPQIVRKLTAVIGAIMGAIHMMGSTYTFATSYSVPDHSVTKGVPYPHFVKVLDDLTKQRDFLMAQLPAWPVWA